MALSASSVSGLGSSQRKIDSVKQTRFSFPPESDDDDINKVSRFPNIAPNSAGRERDLEHERRLGESYVHMTRLPGALTSAPASGVASIKPPPRIHEELVTSHGGVMALLAAGENKNTKIIRGSNVTQTLRDDVPQQIYEERTQQEYAFYRQLKETTEFQRLREVKIFSCVGDEVSDEKLLEIRLQRRGEADGLGARLIRQAKERTAEATPVPGVVGAATGVAPTDELAAVRRVTTVRNHRVIHAAHAQPLHVPTFDRYRDMDGEWSKRRQANERFTNAVHQVIQMNRLQRRRHLLSKHLHAVGLATKSAKRSSDSRGSKKSLKLEFDVQAAPPFTFPKYERTRYEVEDADMAPVELGSSSSFRPLPPIELEEWQVKNYTTYEPVSSTSSFFVLTELPQDQAFEGAPEEVFQPRPTESKAARPGQVSLDLFQPVRVKGQTNLNTLLDGCFTYVQPNFPAEVDIEYALRPRESKCENEWRLDGMQSIVGVNTDVEDLAVAKAALDMLYFASDLNTTIAGLKLMDGIDPTDELFDDDEDRASPWLPPAATSTAQEVAASAAAAPAAAGGLKRKKLSQRE